MAEYKKSEIAVSPNPRSECPNRMLRNRFAPHSPFRNPQNANVSQHPAIMRDQEIIVTRRAANPIYNRTADQRVVELMNTMQDLFC